MTRLKNNMAASRNVDVTKITIKCPFFFYWGFNVSFGIGLETGFDQGPNHIQRHPDTNPNCRLRTAAPKFQPDFRPRWLPPPLQYHFHGNVLNLFAEK